jgi:hypothetical protein
MSAVPKMVGFVPRTRPTVIPLRCDVHRCAIVDSMPRDRVLAVIAAKLYDVMSGMTANKPGNHKTLAEAYK